MCSARGGGMCSARGGGMCSARGGGMCVVPEEESSAILEKKGCVL